MPFQPFGYRFQVDLTLPPSSAKTAISQRMKPWFEAKNGARGWIAGPFICLWLNALNRHGPMLFGTISGHNFGTRISGRAGSDLNGIIWFVGLAAFLIAVTASEMISGAVGGGTVFAFGLSLVMLTLILWLAHKDRREAEPLVRFLEETLSGPRPKRRLEFNDVTISKELKLDIDGDGQEPPVTAEHIAKALQAIEEDGFLILSSSDEVYIQTAASDGDFVIDKRSGSADSHMEAVRSDAADSRWLKRNFTIEETLATLLAYATDAPMPRVIEWRPMY